MVTTLGRLDSMITWSYEVTWLIKNDISPLPRGPSLPNFTRWGFMVKGHHPLSLFDTLMTDHVITWQMKNVISQLRQDLWLPNLTKWWILMQAYYLSGHKTCWSRGHIRLHENDKCFLNSLSRDQSLSDLTNMSNHSATYSFNRLVTWVHVTKWTSLYLYFREAYCY